MESEVDYLSNFTNQEFGKNVKSLFSNINKKYDNIYAKGNSMHSGIIRDNPDFDTRAILTAAVKPFTSAEILAFYKEEFLSEDRRLSFEAL